MKVILLKAIPGNGYTNEVKEVSDGYAINYLLPRREAIPATAKALANIKIQAATQAKLQVDSLKQAQSAAAVLLGMGEIEINARAADSGKLYASVTRADIAAALAKKQFKAQPKSILLTTPLKTVGRHIVAIRLHRDLAVNLLINVKAS